MLLVPCVPSLQSAYLWITFFTRFKKPRPIILFIAAAWGKEVGTHLEGDGCTPCSHLASWSAVCVTWWCAVSSASIS